MQPYLHADCVSRVTTYELFSVICHHGTAGGGHYTCYANNSGQWYEFDDQCVTRVSAETVQNCEAYVLFYRKTSEDANAAAATTAATVNRKLTELSRKSCDSVDDEVSNNTVPRFLYRHPKNEREREAKL